jgi:hypothetical protein
LNKKRLQLLEPFNFYQAAFFIKAFCIMLKELPSDKTSVASKADSNNSAGNKIL